MYMYIYTLMYSKNLVGIIIYISSTVGFFFHVNIKMKNVLNDKKASITYIIIFLIRYIDLI